MRKAKHQRGQPTGMPGFTVVWLGQLVSLLGSGMTTFAISIWAWQETGQATALALAGFFGFGPTVLLSPFAGAIVDRYNRKLVMMLSDLAAGLSTVALFLLYVSGDLQIWHIYIANAFAGTFAAFQFPAYSAAVTTMLEKKHYARATGMLSLAESASGIFAPLLAGALIGLIGIGGIMFFDIVTFSFAIGALLLVYIPEPQATEEGLRSRGNFIKESFYGFKYIFEKRGLLGLQLVFFAINFIAMFSFILLPPMILARTGNNELILGAVQSIGSIGGVVGGVAMSVWGGTRRKIHGVLLGMVLVSLSQGVMGTGQSLLIWGAANFMVFFVIPILNGSNQAIWQSKVAPDIQGRVFATRRLIAQITAPLAMLLAGPLADQFFEPAMQPGGALADLFGWLVGSGAGAGMGLMFVLSGTFGVLVGLAGYTISPIRSVEVDLPDYDQVQQTVADPLQLRKQQLQVLLLQREKLLQRPDTTSRRAALQSLAQNMRRLGKQAIKE
jgi:MFS transporter, DHA3 family, macrolide efflux protein